MRWKPEDFGNISSTRLPYDKVNNHEQLQYSGISQNKSKVWNIIYFVKVWRPDIVLYNFAGQEYGSNEMSTFIQVFNFQHRRCSSSHNSLKGITHSPHFLIRGASAYSNSVLTFPNNMYVGIHTTDEAV